MKNPKTNPEIEAIKNRLRQEILPEGYIPNSRVAKQLDLLDATATLEYAKKQNRKVRRALPGECEAKGKNIYKQYQKQSSKNKDLYSANEIASKIGVSRKTIMNRKNEIDIKPVKIGKRFYFTEIDYIKLQAICKNVA
ncbi:helix-turn-helix domain-containing protein [Chryseobacterium bernardetii]|uniref:helix-turn-helix domain-containing protein n=1 Tax=Chryseobacterium bernardetii TaxID=1241978 RepID=UPI001627071D|nr:helix-turn-helix domain-containing protein [Chryseobacterium bernardetii]